MVAEQMEVRPRAELWPHLTNHERACLIDWWVALEQGSKK